MAKKEYFKFILIPIRIPRKKNSFNKIPIPIPRQKNKFFFYYYSYSSKKEESNFYCYSYSPKKNKFNSFTILFPKKRIYSTYSYYYSYTLQTPGRKENFCSSRTSLSNFNYNSSTKKECKRNNNIPKQNTCSDTYRGKKLDPLFR